MYFTVSVPKDVYLASKMFGPIICVFGYANDWLSYKASWYLQNPLVTSGFPR